MLTSLLSSNLLPCIIALFAASKVAIRIFPYISEERLHTVEISSISFSTTLKLSILEEIFNVFSII